MDAAIGHNNPPSALARAAQAITDLRSFANDHPGVTDHEQAKAANLQISRGKAALKELDAERRSKVDPLNAEVKTINGEFKAVSEPLEKTVEAIEAPLKTFIRAEEERRRREAEEARRRAEEAERIAREAEAREREAIENAAAGDLDADRVGATLEADAAFSRFEQANRAAARSDRDTKVKVGGGLGRAASLRTVEELVITDAAAAVTAMTGDVDLASAVITAARRFRKDWGELPPGISSQKVRI
jgi:hypothetical protein